MIAHVATFEGTPEQLDEAVRLIREEVDPYNARRPGLRPEKKNNPPRHGDRRRLAGGPCFARRTRRPRNNRR